MYRIVFILLLPLGLFAQNFKDDFPCNEKHCSHHHLSILEELNRSFENTNPLLNSYDVKFYKLDLEVYDTTNLFSGSTSILFQVINQPMDTFLIEIWDGLVVDSVIIENQTQLFQQNNEDMFVFLSTTAQIDSLIEVNIFYHTPEGYSTNYFSSTLASDYGDFPVTQTLSEPFFAHHWFPCKQELHDKADSVYVHITTDTSLHVASLGTLNKVDLGNGKRRWEWQTHYSTAYYLIAIAVSDYEEYEIYAKPDNYNDSILILNYLYDYPEVLENNQSSIDHTAGLIEFLSEKYGLYPYHEEKYGHYMFTPPLFSGMENLTMSGMRYFNVNLIAHELGHSWFGNNVTCANWSDIWINEGFATYTQYIAYHDYLNHSYGEWMVNYYHDIIMGIPDGSVYIPESEITSWQRIFNNRLTYRKGGMILHTLRYLFDSDSLFFETYKSFQSIYKDSVATGLDFKIACESVTGRNFDNFFNEWYFGEGFPTYHLDWCQDGDTISMQIHQETSTTETPLFTTPVEYFLNTNEVSDTIFKISMESNDTLVRFYFPHTLHDIQIDPDNWIINKEIIRHQKYFNLQVFLEGPYDSNNSLMSTNLHDGHLPYQQPFNISPWFYEGDEVVSSIPDSVTDWILVEIRDTTDASLATSRSIKDKQAAFLTRSGRIVGMDGNSLLVFDTPINNSIFTVIHHRNHLPVLSSESLQNVKGTFEYNFTDNFIKTYGGESGCKEISIDRWGMIAADSNADGIIDENDLFNGWNIDGGKKGYFFSDFNMDSEINNIDKDDFWYPNLEKTDAVPD